MTEREEHASSEVCDSPSCEGTPTPEEDSLTSGDCPQALVEPGVHREVTRDASGDTGTKGKEGQAIGKRVVSTYKWFELDEWYEFIRAQDTEEHVFTPQSAITQNITSQCQPSAGDGDTVEFDAAAQSLPGTEAANVSGSGGTPAPVQGSGNASKRHGVRGSSLGCQAPPPGRCGSHHEEADRDSTDGRHRQQSGLFKSPGAHSPGPRGVGDRGLDGGPATTADHASTRRGLSVRCPATPDGPRSSDDRDADKEPADQRRGSCSRRPVPFRHPESARGHEPGRDGARASDRPEGRSNPSLRLRATPAGPRCSEDKTRAKRATAERPCFHRGSSVLPRLQPHGPAVAQAQKKERHLGQERRLATARGPGRRPRPDNGQGQGHQVRRLPPLQRAPALAGRPFPGCSLHAAHLPACAPTGGPESAPRGEPGPCRDLPSRPKGRSPVSRRRVSPRASEKPGAQDVHGLRDAGNAHKMTLLRYLLAASDELLGGPQAPPPEAQVHKPQGREGKNEGGTAHTPAQPREKAGTSKEDPRSSRAQ